VLSHSRIWSAIDKLAEAHDLTPSGLAKRAGLDSTTFNKSKRLAADGRARWPSTESIAKIIEATGTRFEDFTALVNGEERDKLPYSVGEPKATMSAFHDVANQHAYIADGAARQQRQIPLLGLAQAGGGGYFDDAGFPVAEGWERITFPVGDALDDNAYALEITGDSMLPLYREGDRIIVSPSATVRKGDRVVAKTRKGEVMAKILKRKSTLGVVLSSVNPEHEDREFAAVDIEWMARIVWASQ